MALWRSKKRREEHEKAARARMRAVRDSSFYQWADPVEVDKQVRSRTDAPTKSAQRKEADAQT